MKPLAIFGGTFDPIHLGHLCVAWEASELLDAEVLMMPSGIPPHRPPPIASADQRVAMLQVALRDQSRLTLDTRELTRSGPSYTVDTLRDLRKEIGERRSLILLVGEDAFASLPMWHEWRDLFDLAHLGILSRPGAGVSWPTDLEKAVDGRMVAPDQIASSAAGYVVRIGVTPLAISASEIRALLAAGRSPRYLLPAALVARPDLLGPYRRH